MYIYTAVLIDYFTKILDLDLQIKKSCTSLKKPKKLSIFADATHYYS
jgi:hypothetical protein